MPRRALVLLPLVLCALLVSSPRGFAEPPQAALEREISELRSAADLPAEAAEPLEMAARARHKAIDLSAAGQTAAAERALAIARAAVTLAARRLALARERADLRVAEHARKSAEARAQLAAQALEVERRRVRELSQQAEGTKP